MGKNLRLGFVNILLIALVIGLAIILSGVLKKDFQQNSNGTPIGSSYFCCDSGDGDACKPSTDKKFMWKGTNAQPEEYALLKSNILLEERAGHIDAAPSPDDKTPDGNRIFLNTTAREYPNGYDPNAGYDVTNCQGPNQDFIFKSTKPPLVCQGIPDDEIIYACTSGCDSDIGQGKFDIYYRTKDGPIPDVIKNCEKPTSANGQPLGQPTIVLGQQPQREDLQLQTFNVIQNSGPVPWLSPFCKPAVYLYPKSTSYVSVRINSSEPLTYSNPTYPSSGWGVIANSNGEIFYQNKPYDYLYYETKVADEKLTNPSEGFVVEKGKLANLFSKILPKLGLNSRETEQFSDYWVRVLPSSPYYFVGIVPQENLSEFTSLDILPRPQTKIRVTLYFEPLEQKIDVAEPVIIMSYRTGFTVVEWGGIFKKNSDTNFSCFQ